MRPDIRWRWRKRPFRIPHDGAMAWILAGSSRARRTRLHTERGQLLPAREWTPAAVTLVRRLTATTQTGPWLAPPAVRWLDRTMQPSWSVFEFGSGTSTAWLASRCKSILSVEDDPEWHARTISLCEQRALSNYDVRLCQCAAWIALLRSCPEDSFDLALVDGNDVPECSRLDCLRAASDRIRPNGFILLDDSDRDRYASADKILAGWAVRRFVGVKARPWLAVETSVFQRPRA
jgi:Methyltransferase domain